MCCGEGGTLQTNFTDMCGECSQCLGHSGFLLLTACVLSCSTQLRVPGCSAGELSKASPRLHELPKSKLLRFRFLGTPQTHRLSWACVLCPSQVRGAQMTRCLASAVSQVCGASYHLSHPSHSVSWVHCKSAISGVPCVSSGGMISGCDTPGRCQLSRIPGRLG